MPGLKGKGHQLETSEVDEKMKSKYSVIATSENCLAHNVSSKITSYEILRSDIGTFSGLDKSRPSNSSSTNCSFIEGRADILPKLIENRATYGFRPGYNEQHIPKLQQEYSSFLNNTNSIPLSQFSHSENPLVEDSPNTFDVTKKKNTVNPSILEQEHRDGEEVVNLLMSLMQQNYRHELPEDVNSFNSISPGDKNDNSHMNFKNKLEYSSRRPIDKLKKGLLDFLPTFQNSEAHQSQWMELWENYTESVWGNRPEAADKAEQVNKNSSQAKPEQLFIKPIRRLEGIWCHL